MAPELVLFDLDGTLVQTAPDICDAVNDTLQALRLPPVALEKVERWIGHGTQALLLRALADTAGHSPGEIRAGSLWRTAQPLFAAHYERRCGTTSRLYPQAREVLRTLAQRGVRTALVTNKELRFTMPLLRRHGLHGLLERVVCGDMLPSRKPDPAGVLDCLRAFGIPAARAVFVGDSAIDVAAARNAGVAAWAVTHGYNMGEPIAASRPDRLLRGLDGILETSWRHEHH